MLTRRNINWRSTTVLTCRGSSDTFPVECLKSSDRTVNFTWKLRIGKINILLSEGLLLLEGSSFRDLSEVTIFWRYFSRVFTLGSLRCAHKISTSVNCRTSGKDATVCLIKSIQSIWLYAGEVVIGLSLKGNTVERLLGGHLWGTVGWPLWINRGKSNEANNQLNCDKLAQKPDGNQEDKHLKQERAIFTHTASYFFRLKNIRYNFNLDGCLTCVLLCTATLICEFGPPVIISPGANVRQLSGILQTFPVPHS